MLIFFAVIANRAFLPKVGYYIPWYLAGGILIIIGGALMYTVEASTSASNIYGYMALIGHGVCFGLKHHSQSYRLIVEPMITPVAVGFIFTAQIDGITLALAIANAMFLNKS